MTTTQIYADYHDHARDLTKNYKYKIRLADTTRCDVKGKHQKNRNSFHDTVLWLFTPVLILG